MRLFVAVQLPHDMMNALAETQALLRECAHGRFTAPNTLHVTLAFLGEVPSMRVDDAIDALECGCAHYAAFPARLSELGSFGPRKNATLWQGFADETAFASLAGSVRTELARRDLPYDPKPLRAHVTLMRHVNLSAGTLPMPVCARGTIDHVTLFSSTLTSDGPIYTPLRTCALP